MRSEITGFLLVMAFALRASAEPTFPGGIQDAGGIPCTPTCLLCHTAIPGTLANLKQPFGLAVLRNGVVPGDPNSLHAVVDKLREKQTDSDDDGKIDVDELSVGSNPNLPDPNAELCAPLYGCGAHLAPQPPPQRPRVLWWLVTAVALGALLRARRRPSTQ
jgi:MYXO-CTERM domain-containing protein